MKKETILIPIFIAILFGIIALIIDKNATSKKPLSVTESYSQTSGTQQKTVLPEPGKPTTVPSISTTPQKDSMKKSYDSAPEMKINPEKKYTATFSTSAGEMVVELFADKTPKTVNNFVFLARDNFYDNTIFHRTIKGFMIQGGDPEGTGMGGPGYRFNDEAFDEEYTRGTLAMANSGPNTNGSQFFIMHQDYPLPPNYVIFGRLISGLETLDAIATAPVSSSLSGEKSKPVTPVTVTNISINEE